MVKIIVYHKECLCHNKDWHHVQEWAQSYGFELCERRTAYNPMWHKMAAEIWFGDENYPDFLSLPGHEELSAVPAEMVIKTIKEGRGDDLFKLFRAENAD